MQAHEFMHAVAKMLPCLRCRREWCAYLDEKLRSFESEHLDSRDAFSRFLVEGHNFVNRRLGKRTYSYDEVKRMYTTVNVVLPVRALCGVFMLVVIAVALTVMLTRRSSLRDCASAMRRLRCSRPTTF